MLFFSFFFFIQSKILVWQCSESFRSWLLTVSYLTTRPPPPIIQSPGHLTLELKCGTSETEVCGLCPQQDSNPGIQRGNALLWGQGANPLKPYNYHRLHTADPTATKCQDLCVTLMVKLHFPTNIQTHTSIPASNNFLIPAKPGLVPGTGLGLKDKRTSVSRCQKKDFPIWSMTLMHLFYVTIIMLK